MTARRSPTHQNPVAVKARRLLISMPGNLIKDRWHVDLFHVRDGVGKISFTITQNRKQISLGPLVVIYHI